MPKPDFNQPMPRLTFDQLRVLLELAKQTSDEDEAMAIINIVMHQCVDRLDEIEKDIKSHDL